jgi:hypothetical protein
MSSQTWVKPFKGSSSSYPLFNHNLITIPSFFAKISPR